MVASWSFLGIGTLALLAEKGVSEGEAIQRADCPAEKRGGAHSQKYSQLSDMYSKCPRALTLRVCARPLGVVDARIDG